MIRFARSQIGKQFEQLVKKILKRLLLKLQSITISVVTFYDHCYTYARLSMILVREYSNIFFDRVWIKSLRFIEQYPLPECHNFSSSNCRKLILHHFLKLLASCTHNRVPLAVFLFAFTVPHFRVRCIKIASENRGRKKFRTPLCRVRN